MSTGLELVVRPFQTNDVRPSGFSIPEAGVPAAEIVLLVGEEGKGTTFTGSFSEKKSFYQKTSVKRAGKRQIVRRRVENPDDKSQHVDVGDIKKYTTKQGSGQDYHETDIWVGPTPPETSEYVGPDPAAGEGGGSEE